MNRNQYIEGLSPRIEWCSFKGCNNRSDTSRSDGECGQHIKIKGDRASVDAFEITSNPIIRWNVGNFRPMTDVQAGDRLNRGLTGSIWGAEVIVSQVVPSQVSVIRPPISGTSY